MNELTLSHLSIHTSQLIIIHIYSMLYMLINISLHSAKRRMRRNPEKIELMVVNLKA